MKTIKHFALLLAFVLPFATSAQETGMPTDKAAIQHVMEVYHEAVVTHDGNKLASLFIPDGSTWINVLSDDAYRSAKLKNPNASKIRVSSFREFANLVTSSKVRFNPTHTNVDIHTDGTIACVYFDFVFLANGKPQNRGSETWQLVKDLDGWRIATIVYSSTPDAK
ncbi:MAG: hypothetical protein ACRYFU_10225 [Janthinobacterium lividum]